MEKRGPPVPCKGQTPTLTDFFIFQHVVQSQAQKLPRALSDLEAPLLPGACARWRRPAQRSGRAVGGGGPGRRGRIGGAAGSAALRAPGAAGHAAGGTSPGTSGAEASHGPRSLHLGSRSTQPSQAA